MEVSDIAFSGLIQILNIINRIKFEYSKFDISYIPEYKPDTGKIIGIDYITIDIKKIEPFTENCIWHIELDIIVDGFNIYISYDTTRKDEEIENHEEIELNDLKKYLEKTKALLTKYK